jgi:hypothetical protein
VERNDGGRGPGAKGWGSFGSGGFGGGRQCGFGGGSLEVRGGAGDLAFQPPLERKGGGGGCFLGSAVGGKKKITISVGAGEKSRKNWGRRGQGGAVGIFSWAGPTKPSGRIVVGPSGR